MKSNLEHILRCMKGFDHDVKAEVLLAEISHYLLPHEEFLINYKGQSKRPYRKDILGTKITDFQLDSTQFLSVDLSRDGLYDSLPENYFHDPKIQTDGQKSVDMMTLEYRLNKKEEEWARLFFKPFENEIFSNGVRREHIEKELLFEIDGSKPLDFFYDFWDLERSLPEKIIAQLMRILPYVNRITGDLDLTRYCLSYLIEETVELEHIGYRNQANHHEDSSLGDSRLGLDLVLGEVYMDHSYYLKFKIGPLKSHKITDFIHQGQLKRFVQLFFDYFLPMEVDAEVEVVLAENQKTFELEESILGITTTL